MIWLAHHYPAEKSNSFSLMAHDGRLRFVTCAENEQEMAETSEWLRGLKTGASALCIYKDGKPFRIIP